jgi:hypothetical protein
MQASDVVIATVTWARSDREADHLVRSLATLKASGLPIVVADRGASERFVERLQAIGGIDVEVTRLPGLVAQAQDAIARAATVGRRYVLYTEPDKSAFFEHGLADFLQSAPAADGGVVLAARSPASMATFPSVQRYTEGVFNHLAGEQLGVPGD